MQYLDGILWAVLESGMTAAAVAELLGITQQAVAKAVVRGGTLADNQRSKLISSKK